MSVPAREQSMKKRLIAYWNEEHSLTALLILLIFNMFVLVPAARTSHLVELIYGMGFSLLLLAGLFTMTRQKLFQVIACFFVISTITVRFSRSFFGVDGLLPLDFILSIVSIVVMLIVVIWQVLREGPVTGHRIRGAIAAYLLLAYLFSFFYSLIAYFFPGSFNLPAWVSSAGPERIEAFLYFSMISLTTAGFGDITPIHPIARSLVTMETLIGQLYPAILIARLVSLEIETRNAKKG